MIRLLQSPLPPYPLSGFFQSPHHPKLTYNTSTPTFNPPSLPDTSTTKHQHRLLQQQQQPQQQRDRVNMRVPERERTGATKVQFSVTQHIKRCFINPALSFLIPHGSSASLVHETLVSQLLSSLQPPN